MNSSNFVAHRRQRGSVLFVALMLLILIALIGVAGMQTTTIQERMAGNYRNFNRAFQNAERVVRMVERRLSTASGAGAAIVPNALAAIDATVPTVSTDNCAAQQVYDRYNWATNNVGTASAARITTITRCISGGDISVRGPSSNRIDMFTVVGVGQTDPADITTDSSNVAIETIFIP